MFTFYWVLFTVLPTFLNIYCIYLHFMITFMEILSLTYIRKYYIYGHLSYTYLLSPGFYPHFITADFCHLWIGFTQRLSKGNLCAEFIVVLHLSPMRRDYLHACARSDTNLCSCLLLLPRKTHTRILFYFPFIKQSQISTGSLTFAKFILTAASTFLWVKGTSLSKK